MGAACSSQCGRPEHTTEDEVLHSHPADFDYDEKSDTMAALMSGQTTASVTEAWECSGSQESKVWTVTLSKTGTLGLVLAATTSAVVHVKEVLPDGEVARFNVEHPDKAIAAGDKVLIANDLFFAADGERMIEEVALAHELVLTLRRDTLEPATLSSCSWQVFMEKDAGTPSGLVLEHVEDDSKFRVLKVRRMGCVATFNARFPSYAIREGDLICSVNSRSTSIYELVEAIEGADTLDLMVERQSQSSTTCSDGLHWDDRYSEHREQVWP
jgi:hypothetical protein